MTMRFIRYSLLFIGFCFYTLPLFSQNWKIQQYTEENGLPSNYLYALNDEKERILIGSDAGLVEFDGHTFEVDDYFKSTYPVHLHRVSDSLLYISTYRNGIYRDTGDSLIQITSEIADLDIISYDTNFVFYHTISRVAWTSVASNNKLLSELKKCPSGYHLSASKDGVYFFRKNSLELIDWKGNKKEKRSLEDEITAVFPMEGTLFTGHKKGKLVRFQKGVEPQTFLLDTDFDIQKIYPYDDHSLIVVNSKDEYDQLFFVEFNEDFTEIVQSKKILNKHVEINDVFVKDGIVFCATYGEGLYVLSPTDFLTIDIHSQNLPRLQSLIQDENGTIWGNSVQNVYKVDINKGVSKLAFSSKLVSIIRAEKKSFISMAHKGLLDMELNFIMSSFSPIREVFYSNDSILLGYGKYHFLEVNLKQKTEKELFKLDNKQKVYGLFNTGALVDTIVYLGTDIGLIELFKTNDGKWEKVQSSKTMDFFEGKRISQMLHHRDTLYIIAEGSLFYYVNDKIREFIFTKTPDIQVNNIMFDSKSNLFIATDKGFWCIKWNEVLHYDENNGLLSEKVYNFLEDRDSNIWIVTGKSLEVIKYKDLHSVPAPKLFINKTIKRSDGISLTVSSYQYDFPNDLKLEYKLNDGEWIPLKTSVLELRNLAPKNYNCYIRGKRNNSQWSVSLVYRFEVKAEWYQTNWFKICVFLILLILSFVIFKIRLRKVRAANAILENEITGRKRLEKKVNNLREEISQDFHDELGNKIASISGISNGMIHSVNTENVPKMKEISKLSSEMYDSTKDFVWLLDPANNNVKSLCLYLRDYGENYFDLLGDIDFFFHQKNIHETPISYEWMKNIVLAFKEITTNVIKHSTATEVTMDVQLLDEFFIIEIYDNGQGFDKDEVELGNGLRNIVSRMHKLGAKVSTEFTNGVKYRFKLKIK